MRSSSIDVWTFMTACGLDFGTSNSALGVMRDGLPVLAPMEDAETLIPSAIFFDFERKGQPSFGRQGIAAYIGQHEGRLMRALKTILGSRLIEESTQVGSRRIKLIDVVRLFIAHIKARGEAFAGVELTSVVHGRPVHFIDGDDAGDARAQAMLEEIAKAAGFKHVAFEYEPIAAAYTYEDTAAREEIVLVADIGGGTSDFSVIRIGPERRKKPDRRNDILANGGARIGGTDFDTLLNVHAVMPLLGLGTHLHTKNITLPRAVFFELATWATINFAYGWKSERDTAALLADAQEPEKVSRLMKTIRKHLGHRIAFAVEDGKIALSSTQGIEIPLGFLEQALKARATRAGFEASIEDKTARLKRTAQRCVADAGLTPSEIDTIFLTGGSCRVPAVARAVAAAAPEARIASGSDLLSVALGLTRAAEKKFG